MTNKNPKTHRHLFDGPVTMFAGASIVEICNFPELFRVIDAMTSRSNVRLPYGIEAIIYRSVPVSTWDLEVVAERVSDAVTTRIAARPRF